MSTAQTAIAIVIFSDGSRSSTEISNVQAEYWPALMHQAAALVLANRPNDSHAQAMVVIDDLDVYEYTRSEIAELLGPYL